MGPQMPMHLDIRKQHFEQFQHLLLHAASGSKFNKLMMVILLMSTLLNSVKKKKIPHTLRPRVPLALMLSVCSQVSGELV